MDSKNRLIIAITVIVLIVGALFTSFGRSLFVLNTPSVTLPDSSTSNPDGSSSSELQSDSIPYQTVSITPETVQNVIQKTLVRSDNYYRELNIETFWDGGSSSIPVQVWSENGWTHTRLVLHSGAVRHNLVGGDMLYYWYEGSAQWLSVPSDDRTMDLSQHIPTYETVLELEPEAIASASYELRGDTPCIYVEVIPEPGLLSRYWVGVDSGLLVAAEEEDNGQLIYRMTAYPPLPCPADASFILPDGTDPT